MKNLVIAMALIALSFGGQAQALSFAPPPECSTLAQQETLVCQIREHCAARQDRVTKLVTRQWEVSNSYISVGERDGSVTALKRTSKLEERLERIAGRLELAQARLQSCIARISR